MKHLDLRSDRLEVACSFHLAITLGISSSSILSRLSSRLYPADFMWFKRYLFLRNDTPGCIRHEKGNTFSEIYLSYLGGPKGVCIPSSEFFTSFPPDLKFGYRRDLNKTPANFIRAYHLRDKKTGESGPWLAGITLEPSIVYEAWCSQRPGNIIVMILEIHGKPVKAGESFSAAHIVGYFDTIADMHNIYNHYKGHTELTADNSDWRLAR